MDMDFTPQDVQAEYTRLKDGREPYIYWKEIPRTKVWYDETDNTFHTDLHFKIVFEGYKLNEVNICLYDLHDKIIIEMKKQGVEIHDAFIEESYEAIHDIKI